MSRYERITGRPPPEPEPARRRELVPVPAGGPTFLGRVMAMLGLSGRAPLRILAVPRDPIVGNKGIGLALLEGRFIAGAHELDVEDLYRADSGLPAEVAERVHSFAWLRDLAAAATHERGRDVGEYLTRAWLSQHSEPGAGLAWRADMIGRRLLSWPAYAPYILSSRDSDYRARVLRTLSRSAREAERRADSAAIGLPRIAAWSGVVASSLTLQGRTERLAKGEAGLARAIRTGLSEDGGLVSRAPHQQLDLVELFALLRASYGAIHGVMPDWLRDAQEGALSALLSTVLGDAGLSSWQGGNAGDPHRIVAAVEASAAHAGPLRQSRGWGYQRLQGKDSLVVLDGAPPPPPKALSGGCASTLAIEFSAGTQRLVINCGGGGDASGQLPDELLHLLRSTAAHSTLTLGDRNSTAILDGGALGKGVGKVDLERGTRDGHALVEASHDGYVRRFGLVHQRTVLLAPDGKALTGEDSLIPSGRKRRKADVPYAVRFHLHPAVEVTSTADGRGALLRVRGHKAWQFRCRGGTLGIEESLWIDGSAVPHATLQLVISGETPPDGMTISWEFNEAG